MHRRRQFKRAGAIAIALALSPPVAASADCINADVIPSMQAIRSATLCLINAERAGIDLPPLRPQRTLRIAAERHSSEMVARQYFAHDSLSGASFGERIAKAGYLSSRGHWFVGENLGWGTGSLSTPRAMVQAWLDSPAHRQLMLNRRFRDIGIGIALGAPIAVGAGTDAVTYTTDFGLRL